HSAPTPGGASTITETRFGRFAGGVFDSLVELGGSLLQSKAIDPAVQEVVPSQANVTALRLTTPLYGAGLIEAIPDSEIMQGASTIAALDHKVVALFSDLLLHDMGTLADGIAQGSATPSEMRTAPLWGLRARTVFLHDGRAATVDSAIRQHDGEAARARDRYL